MPLSHDPSSREEALAFGPFQLFRVQKLLLENGEPVRLGNRSLDLLVALVEKPGEVVSNRELMDYAWPRAVVEESNLRVHISALRKVLGDGQAGKRYIINVPGRGYCFIAALSRLDYSPSKDDRVAVVRHNLPNPRTRLVGRADTILAIATQVQSRRLVTIVGPGGVGKSTVAVAVAQHLVEHFAQNVLFVDLGAIENPSAVSEIIAVSLGLPAISSNPVAGLIAFLRDLRILILLDNCEHVIASVTEITERLLSEVEQVSILATTREPLRIAGECIQTLHALSVPPELPTLTAAAALTYPAVQLFVQQAANGFSDFEFGDDTTDAVSSICRRLDGMPLAIELVAAQIDQLTIEAVAAGHEDALLLVAKGHRNSIPRHQTLRATFDWSYGLLSPTEQIVLRRISVFRGFFTADAAIAIVSIEGASLDVRDALLSLVNKSLLATVIRDHALRYRLLHIARINFGERLTPVERRKALRCHAQYYRELLAAGMAEWPTLLLQQWLARYKAVIDDVRAALEWAFAPSGDVEIGTTLLVASLPFVVQLSSYPEFTKRMNAALTYLADQHPEPSYLELQLRLAFLFLAHESAVTTKSALDQVMTLANRLSVAVHKVGPWTARWLYFLFEGDYPNATASLDALLKIEQELDDPQSSVHFDLVSSQTYFSVGDQRQARLYANRVMRHSAQGIPLAYGLWNLDWQVSLRYHQAHLLWLEGKPDQAAKMVLAASQHVSDDQPNAIVRVLRTSALVYFWRGDLTTARGFADRLLDYATRLSLDRWITIAACFQASAARLSHGPSVADDRTMDGFVISPMQRDELCSICDCWIDPATITRAENGQTGWMTAEIFRIVGTQRERSGLASDLEAAELAFDKSLQVAREQGALAWELRTAISLARLRRSQNRNAEACNMLRTVYGSFTEGFHTADLVTARMLLSELVRHS